MSTAKLRPVQRQSAETLAADSLREFILSGSVKPGTRLTEIALAEQLGVARATLRTGLHRLANEGIVVQIPYTGWQVAQMTQNDAWELWTLRGSLERLATMLVTQNRDPAIKSTVQAAFDALVAACDQGDMQQISECDFLLHRTIVELAQHSRLQRQYQLVEQQVQLFIATSNSYVSDGPQDIIEQHRPIIEAVRSGDAQHAGFVAWQHNETEGRRLANWLATQP
ncbi:MAG TPA: GntR family transcriptional regulator [Castellaniella sp.]|nr:GntR family transcriptional regulator [Castellaniella sp.]